MSTKNQQSADDYVAALPEDRKLAINMVRDMIRNNLPAGYEETFQQGMISYVIPLETYPKTYNKLPLMLAGLASQKNYMTVYLMNIYGNRDDEAWFVNRYKATGKKLNMGKSCVRFKTIDDLLIELIGEGIARTPVAAFLEMDESVKGKP
jgi:hypothetical protein